MSKTTTRKKVFEEARAVLASPDLTEKGKDARLRGIVDEIVWDLPEMKKLMAREDAVEETYTPEEPTYCPECGTWTPKEPPELKPITEAIEEAFQRNITMLIEKARKGKAA